MRKTVLTARPGRRCVIRYHLTHPDSDLMRRDGRFRSDDAIRTEVGEGELEHLAGQPFPHEPAARPTPKRWRAIGGQASKTVDARSRAIGRSPIPIPNF